MCSVSQELPHGTRPGHPFRWGTQFFRKPCSWKGPRQERGSPDGQLTADVESLYSRLRNSGRAGSEGATYLEMMRHNTRVIVDNLR